MAGVVTGAGLGLFGSSGNVLGGAGVLGQSLQGRVGGGARIYVNAVNGNLVLQSPDDVLSGRGTDLSLLRTYNLQGTIDSTSNGLGWSWEGGDSYVVLKAGTVNGANSVVTRVTGDGHETDYLFNGSVYVSTVGDGAHDTFSHSGTTWTWTDGSTREVEVYGESTSPTLRGCLQSQTDASGNRITFSYSSAGFLTGITDFKSGQRYELVYSGTPARLSQVNTFELNVDSNGKVIDPPTVSGTAVKQVSYQYDGQGRLVAVRSYLKPNDPSSPVFMTTYAYDGTSNRISSVTQNDGSSTSAGTKVELTYEQVPGTGVNGIPAKFRVTSVRDANGLQVFQYRTGNTTDITISREDGTNPQTWTYTYDSQQQLVLVQAPTMNGARLETRYFYDAQGNLFKTIDARGNALIYQHDANGNVTIERDTLGNTIKRTYDANNQLLTETHYTRPDAGLDDNTIGIGSASGALTTRYVRDSSSRLRFVISAEGRVIENRYNIDGLLERTIHYTDARYDVSTLAVDASPSEDQMAAWAAQSSLDKKQIELTQYGYDFRGNLTRQINFASTDASGTGVASDPGNLVTDYVYDGHGLLVHSVARHGTLFNQGTQTTYVYDGLGREIARIDAAGIKTTTLYNDLTGTITVDTGVDNAGASHLRTISSYNARGQRISVSQADTDRSDPARLTRYINDTQGRPQLTLDAQGGRYFNFYDAAGRLSFVVDPTGAVTYFTYNEDGQLLSETHYANRLAGVDDTHDANSITNAWLDNASNPARVIKQTLVLGTDLIAVSGQDRTIAFEYDAAGRLTKRTDAVGTQTVTRYDGASRITQETTAERVTQSYYDHDGLLMGMLNPLGYLTEYKYDAGGRLIETVRYSTPSPLAAGHSRPMWVGADPNGFIEQSAAGGKPFTLRIPLVDADGDAFDLTVLSKPSWLTVTKDEAGVTLSGTPPTATTLTPHTVMLRADDKRGTNVSTADVTVHINVDNTPPDWKLLLPDFTITNKQPATLAFPAAMDVESASSALNYFFTGLPPGISFNGNSTAPALTGTPTSPGVYTVTAKVTDPQGKFTQRSFVIQVTDTGAPIMQAVPAQSAIRSRPFNLTVPGAIDPDGQELTYTVLEKPSWLSNPIISGANPGTVSFMGTPPAGTPVGTYYVRIEVADPQHLTSIVSFPITIENLSPQWVTSFPDVRIVAGAPINFTLPVQATDPDGSPVHYSAILPAGLQMDPATGRITGTIANAVEGQAYLVQIIALDNDQPIAGFSPPCKFSFIIDRKPVANRPVGTVAFRVGQARSVTLPADTFIDGDGDALTYTATNLPPGITLTPQSRVLSGTATTAGTWTVTLTATDPMGARASMTFTFAVDIPLPPPPHNPPGPSPGPRPPIIPRFRASPEDSAIVIGDPPPISDPPPPVLVEVVQAAALPPPPLPITSLAPVEDVLATVRPATSDKDLHSYFYRDGAGRATVMIDERGFVTETVYDEQLNQQRTLHYTNFVTVSASTTLTDLRTAAGAIARSTVAQFDDAGRLTSTSERAGSTEISLTRFEYDSAGRVIRQVVAAGTADERSMRTVYDAFGGVIGTLGGAADAELLRLHPAPTAADISTAVTGNGVRYVYDSLGLRIQAIDGQGNVTLYYHDSAGRPAYTVNAKGEVTELLYDSFGEVKTQRSYNNRLTSAQVTTLRSVGGGGGAITSTLQTMLLGLRDLSSDQTTKFEYDQHGLVTKEIDAADMGPGLVTTNSYDPYGQLQTQTRAIDATRSLTTRFDYDLNGRLLSTTADVNGINANTQARYDAFGRVVRTMDAAGRITSRTEYLDSGRTIEVKDVFSLDAQGHEVAGHLVHTEYQDFAGRITQITDATGKTTKYEYREAERSMTVTTPEGVAVTTVTTREGETLSVTHGTSVTSYTYDRDGQLLTVKSRIDGVDKVLTRNEYDLKTGLIQRTTDARGVVTKFTFDAVRRLIERRVDPKDKDGINDNPNGLDLVCTYDFDAFGAQVRVTEGHGNNAGANVTQVTKYEHDQAGRRTKIIVDPDGLALTTTISYDGVGNTVQVSQGTAANPNQQVTLYAYDNLGRRTKEILAPGAGSARERNLTTEYRYDLAGNMTRKIDAAGFSTWYVYDQGGRLTQTINALGEVSERTYDAKGQVTQTRGYVNRLPASTVASFGDMVSTQTPGVDINDARTYLIYDDDGRVRFTLQASNKLFGNLSVQARQWTISEQLYGPNGTVSETRRYDQFIDETRLEAIDTASSPGITVAEMVAELAALHYTSDESTLAKIARTRFVYDTANRLRFTIDALGGVSESVYDDANHVVMSVRYAKRPTLTAFDADTISRAVDRNDINNQVTHFAYNSAGDLRFTARVLASDGHGVATQQVISEQRYDDLHRVTESIAYATPYGTVADYQEATLAAKVNEASAYRSADRRTITAYDTAGRSVYTLQVSQNNSAGQPSRYIASKRVYDALNHVVQSTAYAKEIASPLADGKASTIAAAIVTSDQDRMVEFVYDPAGRERFLIAADGTLSETLYDGRGLAIEHRQFDVQLTPRVPRTAEALAAYRAGRKVGDGITRGEKYTYDGAGQLLSTTDAKGSTETYQYDAFGHRTLYTDKNGGQWLYTYHRDGKLREEFMPEALIQLTGETAPMRRRLSTVYAYDALGTLHSKTEAQATAEARATFYSYDSLGRLTQVETAVYDPNLGRVVRGQPANGQFWRRETTDYDALGNIVRTGVRNGPITFLYQYKTYDTLGRVLYAIDALHQVTGFEYNSFNEQTAVTRYSKENIGVPAPPPGGGIALWSTSAVTSALGTDPFARRMTMDYDTVGRRIRVTQPQASNYFYSLPGGSIPASITPVTASAATTYEYNSFSELFHEKQDLDATRSMETWHYYDVNGHETRTLQKTGDTRDPPLQVFDTARTYDKSGNLTQLIEYARANTSFDPTNRLVPPATPAESSDDRITRYSYDELNRNVKVERLGLHYTMVDASGHYIEVNDSRTTARTVSETTYDDRLHRVTQADALGHLTTTEYDELGQVRRVTQAARQVAGAGIDPFLNQVDASPVTTFTYNSFGEVVTTVRSAGGSGPALITLNGYDAAGKLISTTDANHAHLNAAGNIVADHTYDKVLSYDYAGRLSKETQKVTSQIGVRSSDGSADHLTTWRNVDYTIERRYAYDDGGHRTDVLDVFKDGDVLRQSGDRSVYNAFGEVTAEQKVWGTADQLPAALSKATVATYTYDNAGQRKTMRNAAGETAYFYDLAGHLTRQEERGNGTSADGTSTRVTQMTYDVMGRLETSRLPSYSASATSGAPLLTPNMQYVYDRWGNLTERLSSAPLTPGISSGLRFTLYKYNADNQVTEESQIGVATMNSVGLIRTQSAIHSTHYDLLGRAVEEIDTAKDLSTGIQSGPLRVHSRRYDAAGNLTSDMTGLTSDSAGIETTSYAYDLFGRRIGTKNALGNVFVDTFDANGNQLTHSILRQPSDRNAPYVSTPGVAAVAVLLSRRGYDQTNRVIELREYQDTAGITFDATYTQYDERGFAIATFREREFSNASDVAPIGFGGIRETSCQYDLWGAQVREEDASHNINTWQYDRTSDPANGASPTFFFGRLLSTHMGRKVRPDTASLTEGHVTQNEYNDFAQVTHEVYSGDDVDRRFQNERTYTYYENGLRKSISDTSTNGDVSLANYVHAVSMSTFAYNGYGELASERIVSSGNYTEWVGGETPDLIDLPGLDRTTLTTYDDMGRVKTIELVDNRALASPLHRADGTLTFDYDALGNRRRISSTYTLGSDDAHARTDVTWNEFDSQGRLTLANRVIRDGTILDQGTTLTYDGLGRRASARTETLPASRVSVSMRIGETRKATGFIKADGTPQIGIFPTFNEYSWDESRIERYAYNDLGQLTLVEQSLVQSHKQVRVRYEQGVDESDPTGGWVAPPPPEAPADMAGLQSAFTKFSEREYDLLGQQRSSIQYAQMQFSAGHEAADFTAQRVASDTFYQYDQRGFLTSQITHQSKEDGTPDFNHYSTTTYHFDDAGLLQSYDYQQGDNGASGKAENGFTSHYVYDYLYVGGAWKERQVTVTSNLPGSQPGMTLNRYDVRGQLVAQGIDDPATKTRDRRLMAYDAQGRVIAKDDRRINTDTSDRDNEVSRGAADYLYTGELAAGTIGSGTLADNTQFGTDFTPVSATYPLAQPGSHTVTPGDTLAGIARLYFGDPQLWYLIADANGVTGGPNTALPPGEYGRVYRIPNVVTGIHNNAGTSQPYNLLSIVGNSTPQFGLAPPSTVPSDAQQCAMLAGLVAGAVATFAIGVASAGAGVVIAASVAGAAVGNTTQQLTAIELSGQQDWSDFSAEQLIQATGAAAGGGILGAAANVLGGPGMLGQVLAQAGRAGLAYTLDTALSKQQPFSGLDLLANIGLGAAGALTAPVSSQLNYGNFKFGAIAQSLLLSAFNPNGWALNPKPQINWAGIAGAFVGALGGLYSNDPTNQSAPTKTARRGLQVADTRVEGAEEITQSAIQRSNLQLSDTSPVDFALAHKAAMFRYLNSFIEVDAISGADRLPTLGEILDNMPLDDDGPAYVTVTNETNNEAIALKLGLPASWGDALAIASGHPDPRSVKSGDRIYAVPLTQEQADAVNRYWYPKEEHGRDMAQQAALLKAQEAQRLARIDALIAAGQGRSYSPAYLEEQRMLAELDAAQPKLAALDAHEAAVAEFKAQANIILNTGPVDPEGYGFEFPQEDFTKRSVPELQEMLKYHGRIPGIVDWKERRQLQNVIDGQTSTAAWVVNGINYAATELVPDTPQGIAMAALAAVPVLMGTAGMVSRFAGALGAGGESSVPLLVGAGARAESTMTSETAAASRLRAEVAGELRMDPSINVDLGHPLYKVWIRDFHEFSTVEDAAVAWKAAENPHSIALGRELGSKFFRNPDGTVGYTMPRIGGSSSVDVQGIPIPEEATTVGEIHSHGTYGQVVPRYEFDAFSRGDIRVSRLNSLPSFPGEYEVYVATPGNRLLNFTPNGFFDAGQFRVIDPGAVPGWVPIVWEVK